ncbi:1-acyl-sn-glycerol-3-phosphate acyltransferase [Epidermidibacterium keratini]|uniref:1-acyl-sn-glycerol-3-phosphate acyltransferase n=1 Tax=Epidermidibacterium keratini TaxID=1891644 RepID=A0A7L4YRP6_9ACTN|nr:lysophospholipid acyltransferase family protein [Epidermidibacterium keratini]QHC01800.1 1-acyl-sn-glycerol-3-phosphate acyltransferase [Epidermidibacterium keratini]
MTTSPQPPARGRKTRGQLTPALRFMVPIVRNLSRGIFKERFEGLDNIPAQGPAILVLNHISVLDPLATASFVYEAGRMPSFMIKDSVFKVPVLGKLMIGARQIPVSRGTTASGGSLDSAVQMLRDGGVVAVYPEGTVTRDTGFWPMKAKTGVGRIALAVPDVPVVPIAQWGAHRALNYHTKKLDLLPRKETWISALPPIDTNAYAGRNSAEAARQLTDDVMRKIMERVGQMRQETPPAEFYNPSVPRPEAP